MKRMTCLVLAAPLLAAACSSSAGSSPGSDSTGTVTGSITVLAASSLTEAFDTIAKQVEAKYPGTTVSVQYGASSDLSVQISQGKPADVFASASTKNMTSLGASAVDPQNFVSNTTEIAVPPSNPGKIAQLSDLARSGVKVALCDPAVPCGALAATVLQNAKITVKATANEPDVKSTLALVESGEVDAGLVYVTDVRSAGSKVKGITIPDNVNASTTYPIATIKGSKNAALAKAFVDYVLSQDGQKVLTADGFVKP